MTTVDRIAQSWRHALRAENKSPKTTEGYMLTVRMFVGWLEAEGRPTDIAGVTKDDVGAPADAAATEPNCCDSPPSTW